MRVAALALAMALAAALIAGAQEYNTTEGLQKLISERSVPYFLVDVRTPEEFAGEHIPTAVNTPHESIVDRAPTADRSSLIIVYCRSGARSTAAEQMLKSAGYSNVVNFGAILKWKGELVRP